MSEYSIRRVISLSGVTDVRFVDSSASTPTFSGITINNDLGVGGIISGDGSGITNLVLTGASNYYVTGFTYDNLNQLTLERNGNLSALTTTIDTMSGLTINGDLTVTGSTNFSGITTTAITTDCLQFNTNYTGETIVEGKMCWDEPNGTVSLGMHGGNVSQQIGLEDYYYIKNQSGTTLENGRVIRAAGTLGASARILGEYMIADGSIPQRFALGIATEDILNGDDGYVTHFGVVRGIDTTGSLYGESWINGDVLYVSPTISGGLTKVEPLAPNKKIEMALVLDSASNGSLFVRPKSHSSFSDIQESAWSAGTENNLDVIQWDSNVSGYTLTNSPTFNSVSATTVSGVTFYGDGSNLTNITATWDGREIITVGENVNGGDLLYLGSGSTYLKASNTSDTTSSTELRIAISGITSGSTGIGLIQGQYITAGLTSGDKYWLGSTFGTYTNIQPNGDGDIVRYIGTALNSTTLEFMPDETWVEISNSSGSGTNPLLRNVITSQTILTTDYTINVTTTGATTQTLPTAVGVIGKVYNIVNSGGGDITVATTSSQTINGSVGISMTEQYLSRTFQSDGSNWILI